MSSLDDEIDYLDFIDFPHQSKLFILCRYIYFNDSSLN